MLCPSAGGIDVAQSDPQHWVGQVVRRSGHAVYGRSPPDAKGCENSDAQVLGRMLEVCRSAESSRGTLSDGVSMLWCGGLCYSVLR